MWQKLFLFVLKVANSTLTTPICQRMEAAFFVQRSIDLPFYVYVQKRTKNVFKGTQKRSKYSFFLRVQSFQAYKHGIWLCCDAEGISFQNGSVLIVVSQSSSNFAMCSGMDVACIRHKGSFCRAASFYTENLMSSTKDQCFQELCHSTRRACSHSCPTQPVQHWQVRLKLKHHVWLAMVLYQLLPRHGKWTLIDIRIFLCGSQSKWCISIM